MLSSLLLAAAVPLGSAHADPQPELLAYDAGGIYVSSPPGAPGVAVVPEGDEPAVSADGSRLAWSQPTSDGHRHLFVAPVTGGPPVQVTSGAADDRTPAWSPDGSRLALTRYDADGVEHLAVVRPDGSEGQLLPYLGSAPAWSPDGRFLAYTAGTAGLAAADASGRGPVDVLTSEQGQPAWSPTGTTIALVHGGVRLLTVGSGALTSVLPAASGAFYEDATFNPGGDRLYARHVVVRDKPDDTEDIRRYALDGSNDPSFAPIPTSTGYSSVPARLLSVGGGQRATPAATQPTAVTSLAASPSPSRVHLSWTAPTDQGAAGFTVRYAKGDTPPTTVTDGLPGGDTLGSTDVVGRLDASSDYSFSVFTRDWSGAAAAAQAVTVTTPAEVATTAAVATPGVVTYGASALLSGTLVREDTGAAVADAEVVLLGHHAGQADAALATLTTDADGRFSTRRVPTEGTRYTVRYGGAGALQPSVASALVPVRERVTVSFAPSTRIPAYSRASATVTVAPAFPGGHVRVQQYSFSGGDVLTRLSSRSSATVPLTTSRRDGTARLLVTPGARPGYRNDPEEAPYVIS
jgi:hypothetical protein